MLAHFERVTDRCLPPPHLTDHRVRAKGGSLGGEDVRREMLAADKVGSSFKSYPPPLGDIECFFLFVFFGREGVCGWTGRFGRRLGGRTSFFVFPEAFPLVIIFLTLLPISIPKPPSPPHPIHSRAQAVQRF